MSRLPQSTPDNSTKNRYPKTTSAIWYIAKEKDLFVVASSLLSEPKLRLATNEDIAVMSCSNGERSTKQIADCCNLDVQRVQQIIDHWQGIAKGIFYPEEITEKTKKFAKFERLAQAVKQAEKQSDTFHYHEHNIDNAQDQFDKVEISLSHLYSKKHPALQDRSYGEAFCDKLLDMLMDADLKPRLRILEIGGGVGLFAQNLLDRLAEVQPDLYKAIQYTVFDLSPELQRSQKEKCRHHHNHMQFILGNIEKQPIGEGTFDIIIANEMIADLSVGVATKSHLEEPTNQSEQLIQRYNLSVEDAPSRFVVNVGAIKLIERLPQLLAPNGFAVITEYGGLNQYPVSVPLGEHIEFSINFSHLISVAEHLSFSARTESLGEFLGFEPNHELLHRESYHLLRRQLLPFINHPGIPTMAYNQQLLEEHVGLVAAKIGNLKMLPLKEKKSFLCPFGFLALVVTAGGN